MENKTLEQVIADVRQVLALTESGRTTDEISLELSLDRQYVYNIQACARGYQEDDEIAVAHLVMMS